MLGAFHGVNAGHHGFPIALTQCGARFPNEQIVIQVLVACDFVEIAMRIVLKFLCRLFANDRPDPVVLFFGEHQPPFFVEQLRGFVGVCVGHANESQDRQFFALFGDGQNAFVQIFLWISMNQDGLFAQFCRFNVERQLRRAGAVVVHGQAGFAPHIQHVYFLLIVKFFGGVGTAVFGVAKGVPKAL